MVLGSSGRIGGMLRKAWTSDHFLSRGDVTFSFQRRHAHPEYPNDLLWDILKEPPHALAKAVPFDCMIVLSGIVPKAKADLTLNTAIGVACVAAASQLAIPHVLLASTSAVYGTGSNNPFSENDGPDPVNDYGRAKWDMEQNCQAQAQALALNLCCLRIGNVAGADALLMNGVALAPGESLKLDCFEDGGTPLRSYIGPESLARVMLSLIHKRPQLPPTLNIATPHPVTMRALAEAAHMPLDLRHVTDNAHQYVTLDCSRLVALHKFKPTEMQPAEMVAQWRRLSRAPNV